MAKRSSSRKQVSNDPLNQKDLVRFARMRVNTESYQSWTLYIPRTTSEDDKLKMARTLQNSLSDVWDKTTGGALKSILAEQFPNATIHPAQLSLIEFDSDNGHRKIKESYNLEDTTLIQQTVSL